MLECGNSEVEPKLRIIKGEIAKAHSWPAQILLIKEYSTKREKNNYKYWFQCGGTLINSRTVLTAAHCLNKEFDTNVQFKKNSMYPTFASTLKVYLGAHDVSAIRSENYTNKLPSTVVSMNVSKIKIVTEIKTIINFILN